MSKSSGRLFIISAPSGAGKGTVINRLLRLRPEIVLSISVTTRAPRDEEVDGVSYFFVTRERFRNMINKGDFLEYAEYVGEYYGTPIKPIKDYIENGKDVLLEIEVLGARQVMALMPDAVTIFITTPDMMELERRLRSRGTDTEDALTARLKRARLEILEKKNYKHIVVNDDADRAAEEIARIMIASQS